MASSKEYLVYVLDLLSGLVDAMYDDLPAPRRKT